MRDLHFPGRSVAHGVTAAAATSHPVSTQVAMEVLAEGGSALDAAIAACAAQCVVEPMSTGIGGDCFCLYAKADGSVIGLNGSGRAPAGLTAEHLLNQGISSIGLQSPHSVTVPGAIDAWCRLNADHGTMPMERLLRPAIKLARDGFAVTPRAALDWHRGTGKLAADASTARQFLKDGAPPATGDKWRFPALADTLEAIARGGRDAFYTGPIARDMADYLAECGGTHTLADFAATACNYVDPIRGTYRGVEVLELPPNGQGMITLLLLNILEGYDLSAMDPVGLERIHLLIEAARHAYQVRGEVVADPQQVDVPVDRVLSEEFAKELRGRIDPSKAGQALTMEGATPYRDTVYISVVDKDRNACSFINSLYFGFGSGLTSPKTGVIFQNRGAGFVVQPGHPNCVAPGKRPMHTIIPALAFKDDRPWLSFGVMGGDYQPVGQAQVLSNILDFGMDLQEAIDCPRTFLVGGALEAEHTISDEMLARLAAMGHKTGRPEMPFGGAQAVAIDHDRGTVAAASDPRKDGCAMAI